MNLPPYKTFPTLISDSLILRKIRTDDLKDLIEISFYDAKAAVNLEDAARMQALINLDYENASSIHWGIADKNTDIILGTVGYYRGFENGIGELGCVLKAAYRGKGIMTTALKMASEFGLNEMGLSTISAITSQENTKAIQLLERLNFIQIEELEDENLKFTL